MGLPNPLVMAQQGTEFHLSGGNLHACLPGCPGRPGGTPPTLTMALTWTGTHRDTLHRAG